jgi:hypothetical protein
VTLNEVGDPDDLDGCHQIRVAKDDVDGKVSRVSQSTVLRPFAHRGIVEPLLGYGGVWRRWNPRQSRKASKYADNLGSQFACRLKPAALDHSENLVGRFPHFVCTILNVTLEPRVTAVLCFFAVQDLSIGEFINNVIFDHINACIPTFARICKTTAKSLSLERSATRPSC